MVLACQVGRNVFKLQRKMKGRVWAAWLVKVRQSQQLSMLMESRRRTFRQLVAYTFVALRSSSPSVLLVSIQVLNVLVCICVYASSPSIISVNASRKGFFIVVVSLTTTAKCSGITLAEKSFLATWECDIGPCFPTGDVPTSPRMHMLEGCSLITIMSHH